MFKTLSFHLISCKETFIIQFMMAPQTSPELKQSLIHVMGQLPPQQAGDFFGGMLENNDDFRKAVELFKQPLEGQGDTALFDQICTILPKFDHATQIKALVLLFELQNAFQGVHHERALRRTQLESIIKQAGFLNPERLDETKKTVMTFLQTCGIEDAVVPFFELTMDIENKTEGLNLMTLYDEYLYNEFNLLGTYIYKKSSLNFFDHPQGLNAHFKDVAHGFQCMVTAVKNFGESESSILIEAWRTYCNTMMLIRAPHGDEPTLRMMEAYWMLREIQKGEEMSQSLYLQLEGIGKHITRSTHVSWNRPQSLFEDEEAPVPATQPRALTRRGAVPDITVTHISEPEGPGEETKLSGDSIRHDDKPDVSVDGETTDTEDEEAPELVPATSAPASQPIKVEELD